MQTGGQVECNFAKHPKKPLLKDKTELRRELDEALIASKITSTDACICHQLAASQALPDDWATKLVPVLKGKRRQ